MLSSLPSGSSRIDFSPDGRLLAACAVPYTIEIWNWRDGARPHSLKMKSQSYGIRFSPDGQYIAVAMEDGVVILNARTGQCIKEILLRHIGLRFVAFTPDRMGLVIGAWQSDVKCLDISFLGPASQNSRMDAVECGSTMDLTFRKHNVRRFCFLSLY